ncbi:hypothetical protein V6N11_011009 [Hibiscus sabdariffa]|uniref:Uncharacterized protein n=1 Tax=Hibiscus sabdariffa TaxID=183260 RepID=A0ABR2S749_9ROSI
MHSAYRYGLEYRYGLQMVSVRKFEYRYGLQMVSVRLLEYRYGLQMVSVLMLEYRYGLQFDTPGSFWKPWFRYGQVGTGTGLLKTIFWPFKNVFELLKNPRNHPKQVFKFCGL